MKFTRRFQNMSQNQSLIGSMYFGFFAAGMMTTMLGVLLPYLTEKYHLNYTMGGLLLSAHQAGTLLASFVAGFLPYALGRKKTTIALGAGIIIGLILMTLTGSPAMLLLAFAATGIGRGTLNTISNAVVSEISDNKTRSLNLLHATFAIGAFMAPFAAIFITKALHASWSMSAWVTALLALISLIVIARSSLSNTPCTNEETTDTSAGFLRSFQFWNVTAILFFYIGTEATVVGWLVSYFTDSGIMGTALAQSTSAILWMMMLIGRLLCATFSDRVNKNKLLVWMSAATTIFYMLMISSTDIRVIFPSLIGLGLSMAGMFPTAFSCMNARLTSSTAAGGTCVAAGTTGGIVLPMVVGAAAQNVSIDAGMGLLSMGLVVMLLLTIVNQIASTKQFAVKKQVNENF